jgi:DNA modification methylase
VSTSQPPDQPLSPDCRVVLGDARDMSWLADASVHLVVTSPPYWQLKDYGHEGQLGHGQSFEAYINDLNLVWQECARVLVPGGRLCVNVGNQFTSARTYGRFKVMPTDTEITKFCETVGLDLVASIRWHKITNSAASGGGSLMGSYPFPRNGVVKSNHEQILVFRRPGSTPPPSPESKLAAILSIDDWKAYFSADWSFGGERQGGGHAAMFPEELPLRLIRMFSFPGETVLDPFLGSGTTAAVAIPWGSKTPIHHQHAP